MENKKTRRIGTRLAVFGCALALVTMAGVGMTFAKYTKTTTMTQTGTVAAFGTTLTQSGDLFFNSYNTDLSTKAKDLSGNEISVAIQDSTAAGLTLAPSTNNGSGKVFSYSISGNEVAVSTTFTFSASIDNWFVGTGNDKVTYEPVTFKIKKTVGTTDKYLHYVAATTGENHVAAHLDWTDTETSLTLTELTTGFTETNNYAAATTTSVTYTTTWEWAFDGTATTAYNAYVCNTADTTYAIGDVIDGTTYTGLDATTKAKFAKVSNTDQLDTYLGNKGNAYITYASTLTATQID